MSNSTALPTISAFHYQVLIALNECFALDTGQSVYIEYDGDVSVVDENNVYNSIQMEIKNYESAPLSDNHENLWNTLKNWLDPAFDHTQYSALILHTTQKFGARSSLIEWNSKNQQERYNLLLDIAQKPLKADTTISSLKNIVMADEQSLKEIIRKVYLRTDAPNFEALEKEYIGNIDNHIPTVNIPHYIKALVGFVYGQLKSESWSISYVEYQNEMLRLTALYCQNKIPIPEFRPLEATKEDVQSQLDSPFVKKIYEIDYEDVLAVAVADWLVMQREFINVIDEYPDFKKITDDYSIELERQFISKYRRAARNSRCEIIDSQNFYDDFITENPFPMPGIESPSLTYRNGLIHELMNLNIGIKWKIIKK